MDVKVRLFPAGFLQTNAYVLSAPDRGEAVVIDAPHFLWDEIEPKLKEDGCSAVALLLTHGHYDHIGDAARIQATGARLYGHRADRELFENPECMRTYAYPPDIELRGFRIDHWVSEGDQLPLLGQSCEVRHVPGHCPGNVLFHFPKLKAAFTGDSLFAGSIGRTDLPGGDFPTLERAIRERIYTLPEDTQVYPGHGPVTTVGMERETNPFVAAD